MNICVFLSSSEAVPAKYWDLTRELATAIAQRGDTLVYGGTKVGLMREIADAAQAAGGKVIGVVPEKLREIGYANEACDEVLLTGDLRERKGKMDALADAFVALPGGLGTLEEVAEVLSLKYLRYHQKPVIFLNHEGFYDGLFQWWEKLYDERFTKRAMAQLYAAVPSVEAMYAYLDRYEPVTVEEKWYDRTTDAI